MNVDHLFNDDSLLMIPSRPPSKELYQRLDELRGSGCSQGIAWSKWGSIASIASNGAALELRNLRCHPDNGSWSLSEATFTPNFTTALEGGPLKHLSWSPTGCDLAVIDAAGRVTILSVFSTLNKPSLNRPCSFDPADDLHGIVGSYWLNLAPYPPQRPIVVHGPGVKEGASYRYDMSQASILGPCHPSPSKSAFVCLTASGLLRVIWPQNTGKWNESHTELESIVSSDDLITHAAICPDKNNTLLICYATTNKQLRTVRALIEWNQPKAEKILPAQLPIQPTIKTKHLAVTSWAHDVTSDAINSSNMEASMAQLSHLDFFPPCSDAKGRISPPTIFAIRSHLPASSTHYNQDVYSTMDRWEVREKPQSVHPAFEQLSSRRNSVGSQPGPVVFLKRLQSVTVNKIIIGGDLINHGKVIFIAHSDGSVEYRSRATMDEIFNDGNLNEVWHLSQIGFTYPEDEPCLQVALSPSYCSMVAIRNDGKVKWKQLDYHLGDIGASMDDSMYSAFITALALSSANAIMRSVNYDDLLATANKNATPQFAYDWLTELSRVLKVHVDYSEETHHDILVRNTTIQLCLCIQNSLGFKGEFNPRTFSGKFAWIVLQLRNIVVLITMAANLNVPVGGNSNDKISPLEDPEVINSLTGSVRWTLDLMAWLVDTLLDLPKNVPSTIDLTSPTMSLPDLLAHLHTTNTVSLHFLLSSSTRGFLTAICRRLQHLDYIARRAIAYSGTSSSNNTPNPNPNSNQSPLPASSLSPALRAAYMQIATLTQDTVIKIKTMETLLGSLTTIISRAYSSHVPPLSGSQGAEKARNALEIKMLFGGSIPDAFKGVIIELYRKEGGLLETVKEEIEPAKLFFADFSSLEVEEEKRAVERRKKSGRTMDCFRKAWLVDPVKTSGPRATSAEAQEGGANGPGLLATNGRQVARWRRCARCASVMEDVLTNRHALQWLVMQQRRCFCSGYWDTLAPGEKVA